MNSRNALHRGAALLAWLLLALTVLAGRGELRADEAKEAAKPPAPYRLRAGDEISITVTPQKEYNTSGVVLPDGQLYLKEIGEFRAVGLTLMELAEQVRKVLEQDLVDPRVMVAPVKLAPPPEAPMKDPPKIAKITVVGSVLKSGPQELEPGLRVRKALDLAGGTAKDADLTQIVILHADLTKTIVDLSTLDRITDPAHNRLLQDGDSIEVRALPAAPVAVTQFVRIGGQVLNPGQYELRPGMVVEDLIIAAGKLSVLADVEHLQLRRGEATRNVDLLELRKQGPSGKVPLQAGDEVFIPELKDRVMLVGVVSNPGLRPVKPGETIRDFFLASGDLAVLNPASADISRAQIIRKGDEKPIDVDLKDVLRKPGRKDNYPLQSGDVIFIPPSRGPKRSALDYLSFNPLGLLFGLF